jgi:AraC-like DNA-binding protein
MDKLTPILSGLSFNAEVFFSGNMCGIKTLGGGNKREGHLHMLKSGTLTILSSEGHKIVLEQPSVIFLPGSDEHRIIANESDQADLVCVAITFQSNHYEKLVDSLPKFIALPIDNKTPMGLTVSSLFDEAFAEHCGRQLMIDRLCDVFLVQLLRHLIKEGLTLQGLLAGMAHPQLAILLEKLQRCPEQQWTLETMAETAAMSRAKFAALFKSTVGQAPLDYLTDIRIAIAQGLLKKDLPVSIVANEVGYEHGSALARVFRKKVGLSPKEWMKKLKQW